MPIRGNFEALGIAHEHMQARFPAMAGGYDGRLVVVGSGACVWDDLERAGMKQNHDTGVHAADVMAIDDMIAYYPGVIEHAYSNDHHMLPRWQASRRPQYYNRWGPPKHLHTVDSGHHDVEQHEVRRLFHRAQHLFPAREDANVVIRMLLEPVAQHPGIMLVVVNDKDAVLHTCAG